MQFDLKSRSLQTIVIVILLAGLGYFADSPVYQVLPAGETELKLVVRHSGILLGECTLLTISDQKKVAANMRQPMSCPREKSPLAVELLIDGELVHAQEIQPSGIHDDGVLALYRKFSVKAGLTRIELRVKDQIGLEGYSHQRLEEIQLSAASILIVEFTDEGISFSQPGLASRS